MSQEEFTKLEALGVVWDRINDLWTKNYNAAKQYYAEYGDLLVPAKLVTQDGIKLGLWITRLRMNYRKGILTEKQIQQLEAVGMVWNAKEKAFYDNLHSLELYYKENGHFNVPTAYKTPDGFSLGQWVYRMKKEYESGKMSEERIQKMKAIGFKF